MYWLAVIPPQRGQAWHLLDAASGGVPAADRRALRRRRHEPARRAHAATPAGKPRARALGLPFDGTPGPWNAITDVPGVEVGYVTLIEGDTCGPG